VHPSCGPGDNGDKRSVGVWVQILLSPMFQLEQSRLSIYKMESGKQFNAFKRAWGPDPFTHRLLVQRKEKIRVLLLLEILVRLKY
jgi:hypothetical protein